MNLARASAFSCLAFVLLAALSGQAFSSTVAVGSCTALTSYATIQAAVNAVAAGSIIEICPGNYHEQVTIQKGLTLEGIANGVEDAVVILPPAKGVVANATDVDSSDAIAAQIVAATPKGRVNIKNLTVDGTGNKISGCNPDLRGILYQNASGALTHIAVRNQIAGGTLSGCQTGEAIYVQTAAGHSSEVNIENNSVHDYNKNGITANDLGTKVTLLSNTVTGSGVVPVGAAAQNGIQIGFGATGSVGGNTVLDNLYFDPTSFVAAAILLVDTKEDSGISVFSNIVGNSQLAIGLETDYADGATEYGDGVSVTGNHVFGTSTYDGIDVCTNGNKVKGNTIINSAESGIHLDAECGSGSLTSGNNNTVTGNTILESFCAGILTDPGTASNALSGNTFYTVPFTITSSTGSCTIPVAPTRAANMTNRFSPKR